MDVPQDSLHLGMKAELKKAMDDFAILDYVDQMDQFINKLSKEVGVPLANLDSKVNEAKAQRKIDLKNPEIREVLAKRITLDNWLYNTLISGN